MKLTENLRKDLVKDLRPKSAVTLLETSTVREAVDALQREMAGCAILCDQDGLAVGIFTERDVIRRVIGEKVDPDSPMKTVMSTDLATVKLSDPITTAINLLHNRGLRHLPVIDDHGRPTGVVSVKRVMEYLVEHSPEAVYNLPPTPSPALGSREGA